MDAGWMVDVVPGRWMVDDDAGMDARMDAGRWMFNAGYWMMDGWMVDARMDAWMPGCSMYARMDTWMLDGGMTTLDPKSWILPATRYPLPAKPPTQHPYLLTRYFGSPNRTVYF
jgi:hypothetical protein